MSSSALFHTSPSRCRCRSLQQHQLVDAAVVAVAAAAVAAVAAELRHHICHLQLPLGSGLKSCRSRLRLSTSAGVTWTSRPWVGTRRAQFASKAPRIISRCHVRTSARVRTALGSLKGKSARFVAPRSPTGSRCISHERQVALRHAVQVLRHCRISLLWDSSTVLLPPPSLPLNPFPQYSRIVQYAAGVVYGAGARCSVGERT